MSTEEIKLAVCLTAGLAFISYLIHLKASSQSHPTGASWRGLVTIWLCFGAAWGLLAAAGRVLPGPLFDIDLSGGQVWWQPLTAGQRWIMVGAAAVLVGLIFLTLRTVRNLQEAAAPSHGGPSP